jgi:hypothetical protein
MQQNPKIVAVNLPNASIFACTVRSPWGEVRMWKPADLVEFEFVLEVEVGIKGVKGNYIFSLSVCSEHKFAKTGGRWKDEFTLVTSLFSWKLIKSEVEARFRECLQADVDYIRCLRKHFFWEFEDGCLWPPRHHSRHDHQPEL